jgi:hypothetical protein
MYTPTTNFTFDTTATFVTKPGSATLRRKPDIMRSTPLWGGFSTLRPGIRKSSNQERQTPSLLCFLLRCRDQSHSAPSRPLATILLSDTTLPTFHRPISSLHKLRTGTTSFLLDSWTLRIGPIGCPEKSVRNYHHILRDNPEERSSHLLGEGSLK